MLTEFQFLLLLLFLDLIAYIKEKANLALAQSGKITSVNLKQA